MYRLLLLFSTATLGAASAGDWEAEWEVVHDENSAVAEVNETSPLFEAETPQIAVESSEPILDTPQIEEPADFPQLPAALPADVIAFRPPVYVGYPYYDMPFVLDFSPTEADVDDQEQADALDEYFANLGAILTELLASWMQSIGAVFMAEAGTSAHQPQQLADLVV